MKPNEVKPCPFCGGQGRHCADMSDHWFKCNSCDCIGPTFKSEALALSAWNRRATVSLETAQKLADYINCCGHRHTCKVGNTANPIDCDCGRSQALARFEAEKGGRG